MILLLPTQMFPKIKHYVPILIARIIILLQWPQQSLIHESQSHQELLEYYVVECLISLRYLIQWQWLPHIYDFFGKLLNEVLFRVGTELLARHHLNILEVLHGPILNDLLLLHLPDFIVLIQVLIDGLVSLQHLRLLLDLRLEAQVLVVALADLLLALIKFASIKLLCCHHLVIEVIKSLVHIHLLIMSC